MNTMKGCNLRLIDVKFGMKETDKTQLRIILNYKTKSKILKKIFSKYFVVRKAKTAWTMVVLSGDLPE